MGIFASFGYSLGHSSFLREDLLLGFVFLYYPPPDIQLVVLKACTDCSKDYFQTHFLFLHIYLFILHTDIIACHCFAVGEGQLALVYILSHLYMTEAH